MRNYLFIFYFLVLLSFPAFAEALQVLTWNDCLREASQNHPDLIVAQEKIAQSQAAKKITAAAALPDFAADLNATTGNSTFAGSSQAFSYGLSASQLLFNGLKTDNDIRSANESINAARFGFKFTSSDVRFRLRQAFIHLLKAQEAILLTEEIYKLRKSNLELIALRYESGTEHKGALLTAKANVSQAVYDMNAAQRGLEESRRELTKELGRRSFFPIVVQGDLNIFSIEGDPPSFEEIAKKNPSLLQVTAQKNAAAFNVKSSRGAFWPTVVLNGEASEFDNEWPPGESATSAGIGVTVPLFTGGANMAQLARSRSIYDQLEQQERSIRDGIILDLQKTWNIFANAVERVKVQKDFLAAIEERAKIAQAQYSVGLITFDNWTIIEDDLVLGRKLYLDIQAAALVAQANWIKAQGETMEYEN